LVGEVGTAVGVGGDEDFWDEGPGEVVAVDGRDETKTVFEDDADEEEESESPRLRRWDLE